MTLKITKISGPLFALLSLVLFVVGCGNLYKTIGMDDNQVKRQVELDSAMVSEGVSMFNEMACETYLSALSIFGGLLSAYLGVRLNRAAKKETALVRGIERGADVKTKASVEAESLKLNVGELLAQSVKKINNKNS